MKQVKYIFLWIALWAISAGVAQGQSIDSSMIHGLRELGSRSATGTFTDKDYNGIANSKIQKLDLIADQVKGIIPAGLISDFKIFDFGMPSMIGRMTESEKKYEDKIKRAKTLITTKYNSQNYLLVNRIVNPIDGKAKIKTELVLPNVLNLGSTGNNSQWVITASDLAFISSKIEEESNKKVSKDGTIGGYEGTEKAMEITKDFFNQIDKGFLHGENQYYFTPAGNLFYLQDPNKTNKPNEYRLWFWHHQDINGTLHGFNFSGKEYLAEFDATNKFIGYVNTDPITGAKLPYVDNHTYPKGTTEIEVNCLYKRNKICEGDAFKIKIKPSDLPLPEIKGPMALWFVEKSKANELINCTFNCTKAKLFIFDKLFEKVKPSVSDNAKNSAFSDFCKDLTDIADDATLPDFLLDFFPRDASGSFSFEKVNEARFLNFFFAGKKWSDLVANDFVLANTKLTDMKKAREELVKFPNTNLGSSSNLYEFLKAKFGSKLLESDGTITQIMGPFISIKGNVKAKIVDYLVVNQLGKGETENVYTKNFIQTLTFEECKSFYSNLAKNTLYEIITTTKSNYLVELLPFFKFHFLVPGILKTSDIDYSTLILNKKELRVDDNNNINIEFIAEYNNNIDYDMKYVYIGNRVLKLDGQDKFKVDLSRILTITHPLELMILVKENDGESSLDKFAYQYKDKPPVIPFFFVVLDKYLKVNAEQAEVNKSIEKSIAIANMILTGGAAATEAVLAGSVIMALREVEVITPAMLTQFLGSVTFASLDAGALAITIDPSLLSPDEQKAFFYVYMASLGARIAVGVLTPAAESNIVKLENALATHASNLTQRQQQVMKALIQRLGGASKIVLESEYKEHFLAKLVYQARKNAQWRDKAGKLIEGDFRGNNYAVYEYIDLKGKVSYVVRASEGGGKHSEEICEAFLKENNIPNKNVISIYTERSPCHIFKPDQIGKLPECGARIERDFPSAKVYYTFKYGNISPTTGKDISNDLHQAFMDALKSAP